MSKKIQELILDLKNLQNKKQAETSRRFFKTGLGEYGEGDIFWGIRVPVLRKVAQNYHYLKLDELKELLKNEVHEIRFIAIAILVEQYKVNYEIRDSAPRYKKAKKVEKNKIFNFYIKNSPLVNNWDLVDVSAPTIIGSHIYGLDKKILYTLWQKNNLWQKRIAIVANWYLIKKGELDDVFVLSLKAIHENHDLLHKASGWMLREAGKINKDRLISFLKVNKNNMPRVMLRYAIERFSKEERSVFLEKK